MVEQTILGDLEREMELVYAMVLMFLLVLLVLFLIALFGRYVFVGVHGWPSVRLLFVGFFCYVLTFMSALAVQFESNGRLASTLVNYRLSIHFDYSSIRQSNDASRVGA